MKSLSRLGACALVLALADASAQAHLPTPPRFALAVLGDASSHAYHDKLAFVPGSPDRGGVWHAHSWQWTELLARWRSDEIDLGPWGIWGADGWRLQARQMLGMTPRTPRKLDYAYNHAISGQGCASLLGAPVQQAVHLNALLEREPWRWAGGVVVVRMGDTDLGHPNWLRAAARDPRDPQVLETLTRCQQALTRTVALLQRTQPALRVVLVGAASAADQPTQATRWRGRDEYANIQRALDSFDRHLRLLVQADPGRRAFLDQRAWFSGLWGGRTARGVPAYRTLTLGPLQVRPAVGDDPRHLQLADAQYGTAANALWAQALVQLMHQQWPDLPLTPLGPAELDPLWLSLQTAASGPAGH